MINLKKYFESFYKETMSDVSDDEFEQYINSLDRTSAQRVQLLDVQEERYNIAKTNVTISMNNYNREKRRFDALREVNSVLYLKQIFKICP